MTFNPIKENKIIRNTLFMGNTVWRNSITHEIEYIEIKYLCNKESMTYILLDVHSGLYLANKTLYNKSSTKYFSNIMAAQLFIHDYKEIILYNDFIKQTLTFIEENKFPLFKKGLYKIYTNKFNRKTYFGINWFLIYYKAKEKNNLSCYNFYSLNDLNYFNIKIKYSSYSIITEVASEKYEIIIPENKLDIIPSINFINKKYFIENYNKNTDSDFDKVFNIILSFFKSLIEQKEYEPRKNIKSFLTNFIKEKPEDFIKINNELLNYIKLKE